MEYIKYYAATFRHLRKLTYITTFSYIVAYWQYCNNVVP